MPIEATLVNAPKVMVDGSPLDQSWAQSMVSLSLEMQYQVPTRLIMRFTTPGLGEATTDFPFALDHEVTVSFPQGSAGSGASFVKTCGRLHVTEIGAERDGSDAGEYVVVAHDGSYRMTRRHAVNTFANMKASDIVHKVVSGAGLSTGAIDATSETLPYVLQADTDFGFVTSLARRCGVDWWVDDDKFYFTQPPSSPPTVQVSSTDDLWRFSVTNTAVPNPEVKVSGWDRDHQKMVSGTAKPTAPPANNVPGTSRAKNGLSSATSLNTASVRAGTDAEATALAKAIVTSQVASAVEAQGELRGNPEIKPGVVVEVTGALLGGKYHVTRVEHRYGYDGYTTRFSAGDRVPTGLADFLSSSAVPEHLGALQSLPPLIPATVTTIGTGENLGRVKVKFPYLSQENESHWARVLSAGGGPERGFWFLPEVDDEVLVAFESGDTRFPVVMGGLYGKVNTPEKELIDNGTIASRSVRSRLGHYMDFVDGGSDPHHIKMGLGKNGKPGTEYMLRIGEDRFDIEVPEGKPVSIKAGAAQITFGDDKSISITADAIKISATNELSLEGSKVSIKGQQEVALSQGGNKVTLGSSGLSAKGVPTTSIKGGPQVSIG
ncbi:MAG: phage baseplate assembly protein V [Acidimicrobiales bacterium]